MSRCLGLLASGVVLASAMVAGPPGRANASAALSFNQSLVLQGTTGAGEPSIRTDRFGNAYVIGPVGIPTGGCPASKVSHDGSTSHFIGYPDHNVGGGDCDWAIGPQETAVPASGDLLASSSLTLANLTVSKSDDAGATFGPPNVASTQVALDDRQWMVADPRLNGLGFGDVFMTYHDLTTNQIELSVSVDGGQTYTQNNPVINPAEVPPTQWASSCPALTCIVVATPGTSGNELGNIVARRPSGGALTLYSIFATPDSATDNVNQGNAGTGNYNRLYEAVGTVTDNPVSGTPATIVWHDYEIWHGPLGTRYNRIFPVTAVDASGRVYAAWSDGVNIQMKISGDPTSWGCPASSTVPSGASPCTLPITVPNVGGNNASIMPWMAAGADGALDLVWYGAKGGAVGDNDDVNNIWNVYMAQTITAGSSWSLVKVSDHDIHKGSICIGGTSCTPPRNRTILDFFQNSIDPTNGAADVAWADDSSTPGTARLEFSRQCTGPSATTKQDLVNDCRAPAPPVSAPQGTSCPGPQILDLTGDAPNNLPGGTGNNMSNYDLISTKFTSDATKLHVTIAVSDLETSPHDPLQDPNLTQTWLAGYWSYSGVNYYALARSKAGMPGQWDFFYGISDGNLFHNEVATTGNAIDGPYNAMTGAGTATIDVPLSGVGNPPQGATLTHLYADSHGGPVANVTYWTTTVDRAPDVGSGADFILGQTCSPQPNVPEAASSAALGGAALVGVGSVMLLRRRRRPGAEAPR